MAPRFLHRRDEEDHNDHDDRRRNKARDEDGWYRPRNDQGEGRGGPRGMEHEKREELGPGVAPRDGEFYGYKYGYDDGYGLDGGHNRDQRLPDGDRYRDEDGPRSHRDSRHHHCGGVLHPILFLLMLPFFILGVYTAVKRLMTYLRTRQSLQGGAHRHEYTPLYTEENPVDGHSAH